MRVALMGIVHESNTFVSEMTTLDHFRKGHWHFGDDIIQEYTHAFHEVGGMIEAMQEAGIEIVPIMYAEATPGGTVTHAAFQHLTSELFSELKKRLPVDGCLVVPHGAGVSELHRDMDGTWLEQLRALVGNDIPIIGTIDPHANVSAKMISSTNALVAYKTNPHVDQRNVGKEAGRLMADTLAGKIHPVQCFSALPLAISIEQQLTSADPCRKVLDLAADQCKNPEILSTSLVLGFPYADVAEMGSSLIVIADKNEQAGLSALSVLKDHIIKHRNQFNGVKQDITELIESLAEKETPVLLLDMGDNVGGGSPGNSVYLLDQLDDAGIKDAFICVYDPEAVLKACTHEISSNFDISFGARPDGVETRSRKARLTFKGSGKFSETTPRHGGQVHFDMGDIAILVTDAEHTVMLTSNRVPPYSLNQMTSFGLDPRRFNFIVAKGVNAPIAAYKDVCLTIVQVNTPGVTQADMTAFDYQYRRKPLYPFEKI